MLRALLILLSLLLSAPVAAMPACHDKAPAAAMAHGSTAHGSGEHHRMPDAAPPHACLGCIPPADWIAPPLPAPRIAPALPPAARVLRLDLGRAPPPLLRPPRIG